MPSNHLILCCPLLFLPSIIPSIRVFSNESALCIRWPQYWSFSLSFSLSNEHSGLISFRVDWFDLLVVQGTLKADVAKLIKAHSTSTRLPPPRLTVYLHRGTQLNQGGAQDSGGQGFGNSGPAFQLWGPPKAPTTLALRAPPGRFLRLLSAPTGRGAVRPALGPWLEKCTLPPGARTGSRRLSENFIL